MLRMADHYRGGVLGGVVGLCQLVQVGGGPIAFRPIVTRPENLNPLAVQIAHRSSRGDRNQATTRPMILQPSHTLSSSGACS